MVMLPDPNPHEAASFSILPGPGLPFSNRAPPLSRTARGRARPGTTSLCLSLNQGKTPDPVQNLCHNQVPGKESRGTPYPLDFQWVVRKQHIGDREHLSFLFRSVIFINHWVNYSYTPFTAGCRWDIRKSPRPIMPMGEEATGLLPPRAGRKTHRP